jgi:hypothetical protein
VFVGLVTHARSRFADALSADGLQSSLARHLNELGCRAVSGVSADDAYLPSLLTIDRKAVIASIRAELDSELRWRAYLAGAKPSVWLRSFMAVRRAKRTITQAPPWRRTMTPDDAGARMVRRLVNIEFSHLRIMREAVQSGARWIVLLEDDASSTDAAARAHELAAFVQAADKQGRPLTINLSESFTPEQLGIEHLLTPINPSSIPAGLPWRLFSAQRPVTNTVCAVLYRGDFLARLLVILEEIPVSPVIPIDFKVNEAMMQLSDTMAAGDCWVASPAPLVQSSGVPKVWMGT